MANIELTQLKGIGPSIVKKLNLIGIFNLRDLCFHLPFGYQDRTKISNISDLQPGDEKLIGLIKVLHVRWIKCRHAASASEYTIVRPPQPLWI